MADLLTVTARGPDAVNGWSHDVEADYYRLIHEPPDVVHDGDTWFAQRVHTLMDEETEETTAFLRRIAKRTNHVNWREITPAFLEDFWIEPDTLKALLVYLHNGENVILTGPKGAGKTTLPYKLAEVLGWQEPCKVDISLMQKTRDLFGTERAKDGTTYFSPSEFLQYVERAQVAETLGIPATFPVLLDEINRIHAKANQGLHGLFDHTRRLSFPTTEGRRIVRLPSNLLVIATRNTGYHGTYPLDEAVKDRFAHIRLPLMPAEIEAKKLMEEVDNLFDWQADSIVRIMRRLRKLADLGRISSAPSYRGSLRAAKLVVNGLPIAQAFVQTTEALYDGTSDDDESEAGRAFAAVASQVETDD